MGRWSTMDFIRWGMNEHEKNNQLKEKAMASQNQSVNEFHYSGKVIHVGPPKTYTTKQGMTKSYRELVMQFFIGQYPREVLIEFNENNMKELNQLTDGCWATVTFCMDGNKAIKDGVARWYNKMVGLTAIKG